MTGDRLVEEEPILSPLSAAARLRLAVEALATYAEVRWLLRRGNLESTVSRLRGHVSDRGWGEPGLEGFWRGIRLAKATTRTLRLLPSDTRCLMQSLVLVGLLSRRGIRATLIVGVRSGPDFKAHAWVEHDGRPLLPASDYERLVEL